jgi:hypothetical protein
MMILTQTPQLCNLSDIAIQINTEHQACLASMRAGLEHALNAGALLTEAKSKVDHGSWLAWISKNCEFSERTAQAYMRIAARWPEIENTQRVAGLSFRDALLLLGEPKTLTTFSDWKLANDDALKSVGEELDNLESRLDQATELNELAAIEREAGQLQNAIAEYKIRLQSKVGEFLRRGRNGN